MLTELLNGFLRSTMFAPLRRDVYQRRLRKERLRLGEQRLQRLVTSP
jgi:hypothetical protein